MRTVTGFILAAALLPALGGCGRSRPQLVPAPEARQVDGLAAVAGAAGVMLAAEVEAWPGREEIARRVTPLRVTVNNQSEHPLLLRYENLALVADQGRRYAALPPFEVEGAIHEPVVVDNPRFYHHRFFVAPFYARYYPGMPAYRGPIYHDPLYHQRYLTYWREVALPTEEMIRQALPDGVIEPGGSVSGFLYFEAIEPETEALSLRADLVDAVSGERFGTVSIPFEVTSD
ncbi:MAG: hypothetical protein C4524_12000 [Candidatus Zixiibacteriota bacterium]|nr:MAG: hypothetical protein C4524_12000 [candidate division Zixibacteria bacterium]